MVIRGTRDKQWIYSAKKRWAGLANKYHLREELKSFYYLLNLLLFVWLFGSVLTAFVQWITIPEKHYGITDYFQYFGIVIIELVSNEPGGHLLLGVGGQLVTVLILLMGIVVVGIFTGKVITVLVHATQRRAFVPAKPPTFQFRNPILLCGKNRKIPAIIRELRRRHEADNREIVIVHSGADAYRKDDFENHSNVWTINNDPADRKVLQSAIGSNRTSAILLTTDALDDAYPDVDVVRRAVAIEGYHEKTHTVLEVIQPKSENLLVHTRVNEWIAVQKFSAAILTQAIISRVAFNVYKQILGISVQASGGRRNRIVISDTEIPEVGISFQKLCVEFSRSGEEQVLIGVARPHKATVAWQAGTNVNHLKYKILINPDSDLLIESGDKSVYIQASKD